MKTLSTLSLLAALGAAVALPIQIEVTGSALVATALLALVVSDYTRRPALRLHRRRTLTPLAQFRSLGLATETNRLAA